MTNNLEEIIWSSRRKHNLHRRCLKTTTLWHNVSYEGNYASYSYFFPDPLKICFLNVSPFIRCRDHDSASTYRFPLSNHIRMFLTWAKHTLHLYFANISHLTSTTLCAHRENTSREGINQSFVLPYFLIFFRLSFPFMLHWKNTYRFTCVWW